MTSDATHPSAGMHEVPWWRSLRTQLCLWFVVLAVVPILLVGIFVYGSAIGFVRGSAMSRLEQAARSRAMALEAFAGDRLKALWAVARSPELVRACRTNSLDHQADVQGTLDALRDAFGFETVLLLTSEGRVVEGSSNEVELDGDWMGPALRRIELLAEPHILMGDVPGTFWAVGPILDDVRVPGVLAAKLADAELERIVNDRSGLGSTGEVIAASRVGQSWVAAGPLRHRPDAAGTLTFDRDSPLAWRLEEAIAGRSGSGMSRGTAGADVFAAWVNVPSFGWALTVEQDASEAMGPVGRLIDVLAVAITMAFLSACFFALRVSEQIARPLHEASRATRRLAEGDLSHTPALMGAGETRQLLRSIQSTNADLASLIVRIRSATNGIVATSGTVREVAQSQDQAVRDLAESSVRVATATGTMNATSQQLSMTMVGLARAAEFAATTATSGRSSLVDLGKQMGRLNEGGRNVATRLEAIRERASRIDSMVAAITKVANQTNLLAVNAAIEAEKAGAAGHGFQVVAREIDRLATQTAANVLEIEETVIAVQQAVTEGVVEMSHFVDLVDDGCGTANGVASQMGLIIRQAEELRAEFEQVAHAVESQSQGIAQVNDAMNRVAESARRSAEAIERSASVSAALDDAARTLDADVQRFRLPGATATGDRSVVRSDSLR